MGTPKWNIGQLMATSGNYWHACTLHAGVKLGLFTHLGRETLGADEVAARIDGNARGVEMLLNALVAMGLLEKKEDRFRNTSFALSALVEDSPAYMGYMIKHHHYLVESWAALDRAVLSGRPVRQSSVHGDDDRRESFLMGMFNNAMGIAPQVAQQIDLTGRRRLLDLGGGPGTYAIHFCLSNPQLQAAVYDLPATRPLAEKVIERFDLSDRVHFVDGNYMTEAPQGLFDVVWLSHILHAEGPPDCYELIRKAAAVLEPGGLMAVHEFILDNSMDGPLFPALFALNMLVGTPTGQSYSQAQIMDMLTQAGIVQAKRLSFRGPTESGIITGVKA
jgi:ubiquinone/menaquinone biosynthesis C-methylase UbiE